MRSATTARKSLRRGDTLRAVVEVVPVVAGAHQVVVGSGVVGLVIGVGGRVVKMAGLGALASGLGVEGRSGLTVKGGEYLAKGHVLVEGEGPNVRVKSTRCAQK